MAEKNTDRILDLILNQLEKVSENQAILSEEIQKTNLELSKISGLKEWKDNVDKVVNADDLSKIKEFYTKHQDVDSDVEDLYLIAKELRESSDDYKKFKTRAMTALAIASFLFTATLTILGLLSKWGN